MVAQCKSMDKDTAFRTLELTNSWISNADTKLSFALAYIGVLLGFVFSKSIPEAYSTISSLENVKDITFYQIFAAATVTVLYTTCLISVYNLLMGIYAKVKHNDNNNSLFFFGSISNRSLSDYSELIMSVTEDDIIKEIIEQIHTNSEICMSKFSYYNRGIKYLIISTLIWFVCSVFHYI